MVQSEQLTVDRVDPDLAFGGFTTGDGYCVSGEHPMATDEHAARKALRAQVSKLERELSGLVALTFPHISPRDPDGEAFSGPRLLSLAELERVRDRLALRVGEVHGEVAERTELERRSRALLERMKLEPGRYKFVRVPVADLGDGHCGVWEVRPRLGLIGMLSGWWQVKLSSGCP
ncbi:MAG TPA: hypothetical protein VIJ39_02785 [Solirubrobacteraceae bacterium]